MAIAVQMDFPGATLAQYDEVISLMGLTPGGPGPAGIISHWAAQTDDGIRVVDVWPSREAWENFGQTQVGPLSAKVGMSPPTSVQMFEVHNTFSAG